MWTKLTVLADVHHLAAAGTATFTYGAAVAALLGSLIIILLLNVLDGRIPKYKKFDNWGRVFVAFFGITGTIATLPAADGFRQWMIERTQDGASNAGVTGDGIWVIFFLLFILGFLYIYNSGSLFSIAVFVVLSIPLYVSSPLYGLSTWFQLNVAVPLLNFAVGFAGLA